MHIHDMSELCGETVLSTLSNHSDTATGFSKKLSILTVFSKLPCGDIIPVTCYHIEVKYPNGKVCTYKRYTSTDAWNKYVLAYIEAPRLLKPCRKVA